jgi:hypothetical protein
VDSEALFAQMVILLYSISQDKTELSNCRSS